MTSVCAGVSERSDIVTSCSTVPCSSHIFLYPVFFFNGAEDTSSRRCSDCDASLLRRSVRFVKKNGRVCVLVHSHRSCTYRHVCIFVIIVGIEINPF